MPRAHSWIDRVAEIRSAVNRIDDVFLGRASIESIFGIQRRAALRLMERFGPASQGGEWKVSRPALLAWLTEVESELMLERTRREEVLRSLRDAAEEKRLMRLEAERRGYPKLPSWKVEEAVFEQRIRDLPSAIRLQSGRLSISFPPSDPATGAKLLHELALAMFNDWPSFCRCVSEEPTGTPARDIEDLLSGLELAKDEGVRRGGSM